MVSLHGLAERRACWPLLLVVSSLHMAPCSATALENVRRSGPSGFLQQQHKHVSQSDNEDEGPFDDGPQPSCSCDCCDVVNRLPGEINFGAGVKCSPSGEHSEDMCGQQCTPDKEDKVLKDEVVDLERFCFFECKPAAGLRAPAKSQCVAFSEEEAAKTIDPAGNPMDPAFLYQQSLSNQPPANFFGGAPVYSAASASANLLSKGTRIVKGKPDAKEAKIAAQKGKAYAEAQGKGASLEAARLREMENQHQQTLNAAMKASGDGTVTLDPFAAIQDLQVAANNARTDAERSAISAGDAVKSYDVGRRKMWKLALSEAGKEVLRWKKFAEDKAARELAAMYKPTWQSKAIKKAQEASQPYIEAMLRAQDSVKLYNQKGYGMASSASKLWSEAQVDAAKANKLPRGSIAENNMAQSEMLDAREKAKEAQTMAMESRQYFSTAAEVRKGVPSFQYSAQKAAAQAVAAMNGPR